MKRLVPFWIAALGGFVLIFSYFIPFSQGWGEVAAIWFDVLAAIAFILGGGNLLKIHLKKMSDRQKGWGYSVITVVSFLTMLYVGLVKWGAPPAPQGEYYGEVWAHLPLASVPVVSKVEGSIPEKPTGDKVHASVRRQLSEEDGNIVFRGWMRTSQLVKLKSFDDELKWRCDMDKLYEASQPTGALSGMMAYYSDHKSLAIRGRMTDEQKDELLALGGDAEWEAAVNELYEASQRESEVEFAGALPPYFDANALPSNVSWDEGSDLLSVEGPLSPGARNDLAGLYPRVRPSDDAQRAAFIGELESRGPLADDQKKLVGVALDGWDVQQLGTVLNEAGKAQGRKKTDCELYEEQQAGAAWLDPNVPPSGEDVTLNEDQMALLEAYASDRSMSLDDLMGQLSAAGTFNGNQRAALVTFFSSIPTIGERNKNLAFTLMRERDAEGNLMPLNEDQRDFLLKDFRAQTAWRQVVGKLFVSAHDVKFSWSGEYRAQGGPFWWLFEYAFKPLQATIFAMLAFYVASAAFRAFRAKNTEAILLLGTAFIILLGRTFAGVWLTSWMPEALSGLRIENLTVTIMQIFNTAGNRAIMIGIALGIASTSLKVLLGVDRSYLGSAEG